MKELTLTMTVDEANLVLEALGEQPFAKVYELVGKIQEQAGQQLKSNGESPPTVSGSNAVAASAEQGKGK